MAVRQKRKNHATIFEKNMESPRLHVQTGGILYQKTGGGDDDADHDALRRYPMRHLEWHGTDAARPADTLCDMHLYN